MKKWTPIILICILILPACDMIPPPQPDNAQTAENAPADESEEETFAVIIPQTNPDEIQCPQEMPDLVTSLEILQTPNLREPAARRPFIDPVFGTCLVRVTDRNSDLSRDDDSAGLKNEYSRVQSFNANGRLILARGIQGTWYVYDALSLQPLGEVPLAVEPRWSASDPDLIYYLDEVSLYEYDISQGSQRLVHDFSKDFPGKPLSAVWTRYEGSPSLDGRYWGLMAENQDWDTTAYLIYDLETDEVLIRKLDSPADIDSVTISPLGTYYLAFYEYCEQGEMGTDADPCGLMVYDRGLQNGRGLLRIIGHSDLALDSNGREVLVYQDIDTDHISMLDLETGQITDLWAIDFSQTLLGLHISGLAYRLPGWALVSTHDADPTAHIWMDDSVFAMELVPGGRIVRLAHTHSVVDDNMEQDYWAEPHASVNPDFTRALFTTNWGRSGTEEVEMYMILLPEGWLSSLSEE